MSPFINARRTRLPLAFVCVCLAASLLGQDIHLSQFYNTPLMRNPALAGLFKGDIRVQTVYRNQWQSTGFPYQTNALSAEYKFAVGYQDDYMTVGASCFYDQAGVMKLKTLQVMPALNFHKSLSGNKNSYLSAGFMAGYVSRQFDGKNLTFDNQYSGGRYDPGNPTGEQFSGLSKSFFDIAVGLSYNGAIGEKGNYYVGTSLWHFHKPEVNFLSDEIRLSPKWQFNAGVRQLLSEKVELTAEANYLKQGDYTETIAGAKFRFSLGEDYEQESSIGNLSLGLGAFVRFQDAIIPYFEFQYNNLDIGLSYDVNTSSLKTASQGRGGFELSLSYRAFTSNQSSSLNSLRCPRF